MTGNNSFSGIQPSKRSPRLLHLIKCPDSLIYGFTHDKKEGEYPCIQNVDESSPAFATGLKAGDKVIEVNGNNVRNDTLNEYRWRIKENPNEVRLLVLSIPAFLYYKCRNINLSGNMDGILYQITPKLHSHSTTPWAFLTIFRPIMAVVAEIISWDDYDEDIDSNTDELKTIQGAPPRIFHLTKWAGEDTFGFNVETKGRGECFVSKVEENGIAAATGLQLGDWIIELNGINVFKCSLDELFQELYKDPLELQLLILNESEFNFYHSNNIIPSRYSNGIIYKGNPNPFLSTTLSSPPTNPEGIQEKMKKIVEDQCRIAENLKSIMETSIANSQGIKGFGMTKQEISEGSFNFNSIVENIIPPLQNCTSESTISLFESKLEAMEEKLSCVVETMERELKLNLLFDFSHFEAFS